MSHKLSRRTFLLVALGAAASLIGCMPPLSAEETATSTQTKYRADPIAPEDWDDVKVVKDEQEWRELLPAFQYHVMREQGTERAFTGEYDGFKETGHYHCAACGNPLFSSEAKYDSGTGWPSFWDSLSEAYVHTEVDTQFGMRRTEVLCARCDSHLGHVFKDGPPPTGLRYCMNSITLNFVPLEEM
jgi:peptide-methionine (R)-S-oxide reductase